MSKLGRKGRRRARAGLKFALAPALAPAGKNVPASGPGVAAARCTWRLAVTLDRLVVKALHAALLAGGIAAANPAAAEIDASQADARLIGMPIYTSDGLLIGQVTNVETYGTNRAIVAAIGGYLAFGPRFVWIPLTWANKEEVHIRLLLTNNQLGGFGQGIGSR